MDERMYLMLLEKSREFCKYISVDYMDFLHDIICTEPVIDAENVNKLFVRRRSEIAREKKRMAIIAYIPQREDGETSYIKYKQLSVYKYCKHCDQILPESEFYPDQRICKKGYNNKPYKAKPKKADIKVTPQSTSRDSLKDYYIIDILKKCGIKKEDITSEMINNKREQVLAKRMRKPKAA